MVYNLAAKLLKTLTHMCNPTNTQQLPALTLAAAHFQALALPRVYVLDRNLDNELKVQAVGSEYKPGGFQQCQINILDFWALGFFPSNSPQTLSVSKTYIFVLFLYRYFLLLCAQLKICQYDPSITPCGNTSHVSHKPSDCSQYLPFMPFSIFIRAYLVGLYFTLILL